MAGIPRVLDTDAEDVIWALQTADALWKRGERNDAIVWLRRAAQAAGEMEDDDRALSLAREAAELAEWASQNLAEAVTRSAPPGPAPPTPAEAVDAFLKQADAATPPPEPRPAPAQRSPAPVEERRAPPPKPPPPPSTKIPHAEPGSSPKLERVPSAAELHAGILDPWAEGEPAPRERAVASPPALRKPPPPQVAQPSAPQPRSPPTPPAPSPPAAEAFDPDEVLTSAPPVVPKVSSKRPAAVEAPPPPAEPHAVGPDTVDLSSVEALADLPDDARDAFARAAVVHDLARDEEIASFALALVLSGEVDLSATIVDAPAERLSAGAILRARGTVGPIAALRLVGATNRARVAVWDDTAVTDAFRTCPWVEDDLRAAGDRFQALVGATMGPLGERLDPTLRSSVTDRLRLLALAEHEVFATRGQPIPGLLVVGAGELELLADDGTPKGTVLRPGDFLFPNEVLRAAPAPDTVRAADGGALILLADRAVAQELLVTCPPLLEIFSGA
jgi:hypothetical protein